MRLLRLTLPILLMISGVACSDANVVPVSGAVHLDGEPLANASVIFAPLADGRDSEAGPSSFAQTDESGQFSLRTLEHGDGAVIGPHRVIIQLEQPVQAAPSLRNGRRTPTGKIVPVSYNAATSLRFNVPDEGTDSAHFHLQSR